MAVQHMSPPSRRQIVLPATMCAQLLRGARNVAGDAARLAGFATSKKTAVAQLEEAYRLLSIEEGQVQTEGEAAHTACYGFLVQLDRCASVFHVPITIRRHRAAFTLHYRAFFSDETRQYRVEVLAASIQQHAAIWVNGDRFNFSSEVVASSLKLRAALFRIFAVLDSRIKAAEQGGSAASRSSCNELREALHAFDIAWVEFEQRYIGELIEIEKTARGLLVEAIEHAKRLQDLEVNCRTSNLVPLADDYREEQRRLFACISRLNAVANVDRKGREDLTPEVLNEAIVALHGDRCSWPRPVAVDRTLAAPKDDPQNTGSPDYVRILAIDVAEAFEAMRDYLCKVEPHLEHVAPRLSENAGLVARLADLEESWEMGSSYVQCRPMRQALGNLVGELKAAQKLVPELESMCDACDVEWLLAMPKIVWLCFLKQPLRHAEVLKSLLPHRFPDEEFEEAAIGDADLRLFALSFARVQRLLIDACDKFQVVETSASAGEAFAWELLLRRATYRGEQTQPSVCGAALAVTLPCDVEDALREFNRDLERWSIELQRHCPLSWNQCSALLVRCLTGVQHKQRETEFKV